AACARPRPFAQLHVGRAAGVERGERIMSAPVTELELHAYVDEQLNAERRAEVDAYLKEHAAAAARVADYQAQNAALHALFDPVLEETVPERFIRPKFAPRFSLARVAAAVAWLAVGTLLGLGAMEWR